MLTESDREFARQARIDLSGIGDEQDICGLWDQHDWQGYAEQLEDDLRAADRRESQQRVFVCALVLTTILFAVHLLGR